MILQIRVDDRLIHGQVALVWSKELNTPGIVVANDGAARNESVKMTLKMATPTGLKLLVKTVDEAIKVFNDDRASDMRIFALTRNITDACTLVKNCPGRIETVNVANAGRFDTDRRGQMMLGGGTIFCSPKEMEAARELVGLMGNNFFHQLHPANAKTPMEELIKTAEEVKL